VIDPVDVLDQPHPRGLEHVRRVTFDEFEVPRDRPDEPAVLVDEILPRRRIAVGRSVQQPGRIKGGGIRTGCRTGRRGRPVEILLPCRPSRHRPP